MEKKNQMLDYQFKEKIRYYNKIKEKNNSLIFLTTTNAKELNTNKNNIPRIKKSYVNYDLYEKKNLKDSNYLYKANNLETAYTSKYIKIEKDDSQNQKDLYIKKPSNPKENKETISYYKYSDNNNKNSYINFNQNLYTINKENKILYEDSRYKRFENNPINDNNPGEKSDSKSFSFGMSNDIRAKFITDESNKNTNNNIHKNARTNENIQNQYQYQYQYQNDYDKKNTNNIPDNYKFENTKIIKSKSKSKIKNLNLIDEKLEFFSNFKDEKIHKKSKSLENYKNYFEIGKFIVPNIKNDEDDFEIIRGKEF